MRTAWLDEAKVSDEQQGWRARLRKLQHRFLKFRTRSYFTEVSNQIQGKDLFRLWYDQLGTAELFERVSQTSSEVYDAVENDEMKSLTLEQQRFSTIAQWGLGTSLVLTSVATTLSWAGLFPEATRTDPHLGGSPIWGPYWWLAVSVVPTLAIVLLFLKRTGALESQNNVGQRKDGEV